MQDNPLLKYARRPALTVKLASGKNWYPEGFIQYTLNDEVEVYPMLPKDELMLLNPDLLISGQAIINLIQSCCPSILDPGQLYYPDVNILLLAIKKATYGNEHKQDYFCSSCKKRMSLLNPKEIDKESKAGKLMTHTEEQIINIDALLNDITPMKDEYKLKIGSLTYYLQPLVLKLKEYYSLISFRKNKFLKYYSETVKRTEELKGEDKDQLIKDINQTQLELVELNNKIISNCIQKIQLPDDSFISDQEMIYQYISNCESSIIDELNKNIQEMNESGVRQKVIIQCPYCGNEEEVVVEGFNQTDFFG